MAQYKVTITSNLNLVLPEDVQKTLGMHVSGNNFATRYRKDAAILMLKKCIYYAMRSRALLDRPIARETTTWAECVGETGLNKVGSKYQKSCGDFTYCIERIG